MPPLVLPPNCCLPHLSCVGEEDVNFAELARCADNFNGAQLKAVCVEAGMLALRRGGNELQHEDFMEGINQVKAKKKSSLMYYV